MAIVLGLGLFACGRGVEPGHDAGSTIGAAAATTSAKSAAIRVRQPADDLVDKAEKMLAASTALDYRRPMLLVPDDREPVRQAFYQACRAGDPRSCWMVREVESREVVNRELAKRAERVAPRLYETDAVTRTIENCRQGDRLSCSALRLGDLSDIDMLPGHVARTDGCTTIGACDLEGLARECHADYADSCVKLRARQSLDADRTVLTATARRLTMEGCRAGIQRDCVSAAKLFGADATPADYAEHVAAREQICTLSLSGCDTLGNLYLPNQPDKALIAFERGCELTLYQMEPYTMCEDLWRGYTASPPILHEATPGRAAQLRNWACTTYKACW